MSGAYNFDPDVEAFSVHAQFSLLSAIVSFLRSLTTVDLGLCSAAKMSLFLFTALEFSVFKPWLVRHPQRIPLPNQRVRRRRPVRRVSRDWLHDARSHRVSLLAAGLWRRRSVGNPAVDVDVVIVGAGWAGMAAADRLHKAGVSFVVLEALSHTGRPQARFHVRSRVRGPVRFLNKARAWCVDLERRGKTRIRRWFAPTACSTWQSRRVSKLLAFLVHVMATCRITS